MSEYTHLSLDARIERLRAHLTQRETELFDNELNIEANTALAERVQEPRKREIRSAIQKMTATSDGLRIGLVVMRANLLGLEAQLEAEAEASRAEEAGISTLRRKEA